MTLISNNLDYDLILRSETPINMEILVWSMKKIKERLPLGLGVATHA